MGYITVTADVDVRFDDIQDYELLEMIEDRIDTYKRREKKSAYEDFMNNIKDIIEDSKPLAESNTTHIDDDSLLGELKLEVCKKLMSKYSLEELETFLNK
jgi:hypothetical protein